MKQKISEERLQDMLRSPNIYTGMTVALMALTNDLKNARADIQKLKEKLELIQWEEDPDL